MSNNAPHEARPNSMSMDPSSLLLLISAPSGGGKTTLCESLLQGSSRLRRAVTCTTRPPRPGETDGRDYHFLSEPAFLTRIESGHFLEHARVYGHRYGVLKSEVLETLRSGWDVVLAVDVQGAESIRRQADLDPELRRSLVTVFLVPPSLEVLESRLRKRNQDSEAVIQDRLSAARREISQARQFDYVVVSATREEDRDRVASILAAEQMRAARARMPSYTSGPMDG